MFDIGSNKRQGGSGGLSSRPSQVSPQIRRNKGIIHNELKRSSSSPSNLRGMSADAAERLSNSANSRKQTPNLRGMSPDAAERWSNSATNRKQKSPITRGMSPDAAERLSNPANSRKQTPNLRGMSPDAAERWSNSATNRKQKSPITRGMSPDAAERLSNPANSRKQTPNLRGMSADAAERWSSGSTRKPKPTPTASNTRQINNSIKAKVIAPVGEQNKNNALNQTNSVIKGTLVGNAVANRKLSPIKAKDVLKLVDKSGIGKADLEPRLKASGWIEVTGRWAKKSKPTSPIGSIWTNPARDESITIRPKKDGSFGVRGYDGPSGGAVNHLRQDPKNHKWKSQGSPGKGERPLVNEHPLDSRGRTGPKPGAIGPKPGAIYDDAEKRTHFKLQPESRGVVKAFENSHVQGVARGATKVLAPVAVGLDAWQLGSIYKKDGFGQEFRKEAGRVAGGWGGAAAGAAGGAAIGSVVPVVGTAAGAIVGGVIGGVAGSEFGDDIEQGAEKAAKGIAQGAKKVGEGIAQRAGKAAEEGKKIVGKLNPFG